MDRLAYDPWGKRRYANGGTPPEGYTPATTDRGFTMHEHLDEMGIIHMNGRVYDPTLGRFMSADPYIQAPDNLMSYNRYAYCIGNPLVCSDPSGYNWWSENITHNKVIRTVAAVVIAYYTGQWVGSEIWGSIAAAGPPTAASITGMQIAAGAAGGFAGGFVASGGNFQAGLQGAFSGGVFGGIGAYGYSEGWGTEAMTAAHAAGGCVTGMASGSGCGAGALSAGFAKFATLNGPTWVQNPNGWVDVTLGTSYAAAVGGTASVIGIGIYTTELLESGPRQVWR